VRYKYWVRVYVVDFPVDLGHPFYFEQVASSFGQIESISV